jgi:nitrogen-specific signal transduction histidine kinase
MRGTPASSQIIWLEDKVKEQADEIERLRKIVDRLSDWKEVNGVRVLMKDYYETEIERLRELFKLERKDNIDLRHHFAMANEQIERLRKILKMWMAFWNADSDDALLAEEAMEETRIALEGTE